eukprot:2694328-Pyramimonas_sp.AAC.1
MAELKQAAQADLLHREYYDIQDLEAALSKFRPTTARGPDQWQPPEIKALPDDAKRSLVFVLNLCERNLCWPHQFYHLWYHLLVKAGSNTAGEERPIGLLPFPFRLWGKMAKAELQDWCSEKAGYWDAAIQ